MLKQTIAAIKPADKAIRQEAHKYLESLAMPHWALGRILDLAEDLAAMTGSLSPQVNRRLVLLMCADHGVAAEDVSLFPQTVTVPIVKAAVLGGCGINVFARASNTDLKVIDLGVAGDLGSLQANENFISRSVSSGTANFCRGAAMTREQTIQALETGMNLVDDFADDYDLFATGDIGIANTSSATAILCAITGCEPENVTGRGTGLDDEGLKHKIEIIKTALVRHQLSKEDPMAVLEKVGGFEIAGLTGMILRAAALRKPVVIDGFISSSAALLAYTFCPVSRDYMVFSHQSAEPGHEAMLKHIGKEGLLNLGLRLGEGTGAVLAMNLLDNAVAILAEMWTLEKALGTC